MSRPTRSAIQTYVAASAITVALVTTPARPARADVNVEIPLAVKSQGAIFPSNEIEYYHFEATRGTTLSFTLERSRASTAEFAVTLRADDSNAVALPAGQFRNTGKRAVLRRFRLPTTGTYTLEIGGSGAGTGGYTLVLSGRARRTFRQTANPDPSRSVPVSFAAPLGSTVTFAAKPARGAHRPQPRFTFLTAPNHDFYLGNAGKRTATTHTVTGTFPGDGGEFSVDITNAANNYQAIDVTIRVKPPHVRLVRLDLRD